MRQVSGVYVYARIQGDPRQVMPRLRAQVQGVDSNLVVSDMRRLDEQLNIAMSEATRASAGQ